MAITQDNAVFSAGNSTASLDTVVSCTAIQEAIEYHASQQPQARAVNFQDHFLTYLELNHQANQLAHYLIGLGVGAEMRVCVCLQPSLKISVALLGILKAGAVYVPLDPNYPRDRLAMILEDNQPQVILTQGDLLPNLPNITAEIFGSDRDWQSIEALPTDNPTVNIDLDQTAYIIYTSGTTGKPKGVMTSYRNLQHYIFGALERFGFDHSTIIPAIARFSFSITFLELLSPLVAGGTLMILEREQILDFRQMCQILEQITALHASPNLLKKLLVYIQDNGISLAKFRGLKHVSTGGDLVPADVLEAMQRVFQNAEIYVIYGCSEVSCMACSHFVSRQQPITKTLVGQPFPNVTVRLYESEQKSVPIGETGEVYISGAGVVKGYLEQSELTSEKFVIIDQQRWYCTGDRGRFDVDGNLEIIGRTDFQIKLNGIRIEPGEIEVVLRQIHGVREAVVVRRELNSGEPGIVAYLTIHPPDLPEITDIRSYLQGKLPDYMIPAAFVILEALPLNLNQKVDRQALPAPIFESSDRYVAPRNSREQLLAETWAVILGIELISIHDDFFSLGGNSLLAAQIVSRLQESLGLDLTIRGLFEHLTIASLADHLATLNPRAKSFPPIIPIPRDVDLPLSSTQSRLWILTQLEEGIAYNIPLAFRLEGRLNSRALQQSLSEIVRRHEVLRTIFPVLDGVPVQRILPPPVIPLPLIPLLQESQIQHLAQQEAQRPFDLSQDLPIRTTLLQLGEYTHILLLTIHHIVSDGWSLEVLQRELAILYSAYCQNAPSPLTDLPIQYADFAHWQREWLKGEAVHHQLIYWRQQLRGMPPLLELPSDRPRPPIQSYQGQTEFFTISPELTHRIKFLSQQARATLFMTLLAAFAMLLSRYSNQSQLVIGSPIANRHHPDIEPLIGFFINLLALPIDLSGNPTCWEFLQRIRQISLDAYANQDLPFNELVEAIQPPRHLSHSPLFQVLFILQNSPGEPLQLPGLNITPLKVESGTVKYDLTLMMTETESGLTAELEYSSLLFDRPTIQRLVGHFVVLLEGIVTNPQQPISHLPLLTVAEQRQLLVEWNSTQVDYPRDKGIHQLFEDQVLRTPDAIAVVFAEQQLTYQELNCRANQLAHYLQSLGIKPESLVGISVERSLEMVIGLLGILKAGAAYVPLDPTYPADRVAYILSNSEASFLLTTSNLLATLPPKATQFICLDTASTVISQQKESNPDSEIAPNNLSYVIYTSGSTGKPKGVQICHQSLVNFINSMKNEPGLNQGDRLLAVTTISFDIHTLEIYLPLTVGATIILASREMTIDGGQLAHQMAKYDVNVMQATPATWRMLLISDWQGSPKLKAICGGEALPKELANRLLAKIGSLWNIYGPTETTVWSTTCQVTGNSPSDNEDAAESIGRPIANTQIYILDQLLQPVPIGVIGELYIGGDGVARGYLKRPELNAANFLSNPFKSNSRIYKTGDLARYLPSGNIEYLGRIDNQVKIRGFRIEIGEIENVLEQHSQVEQAIVIVREDTPGNKQLVAYIVGQSQPSIQELRQFLKIQLPDYMIPSAFVMLEALPLTPNGKIDRRALPAPENIRLDAEATFVAPCNELEIHLVKIWEQILGVKPIGIKDNFFELGGHSLTAVRLVAEIEKVWQKKLPLSVLFQKQTIAEFANILSQTEWLPSWSSLVPIQTEGNQTPLFLIHAIGGNLLDYEKLIHHLDRDRPIYGLQSIGLDGKQEPLASIPAMASHYIKEIRTIQPHGPYFLFGYSFGGIVAFEMAQQLDAQGKKIGWLGICDKEAPHQFAKIADNKSLGEFVQIHARNLGKISSIKEKFQYLWDRISYRFTILDYKKYLLKEFSKAEVSTPDFLLKLLDINIQTEINYQLQVYPGSLALFRCQHQSVEHYFNPDLGWSNLVTGGVEINHLPGSHLDLMKEPVVQVLAKKIEESIQKSEKVCP